MEQLRLDGKRIGFVPTMGALHEGHLSLCHIAKKHSDMLVMSIFVNPTQFTPNEDLDKYPRDFAADEAKAAEAGVDIIFYPTAEQMYPKGYKSWVNIEGLSDILCSKSRPLHFRGVTTIVSKLLNIIRPHIMVIGQKDAQQTALLQQMATDLNIDTEIIAAPIIREKDGLAMSSRNVYLKTNEREKALILSKSLKNIKNSLLSGKIELNSALNDARKIIEGTDGIRLDYLEAHTWPSLEPVKNLNGKILIAGAIFLANVRLIDNIIVGQE